MDRVSYREESFLTALEDDAWDTADAVARLRDRTRRQSTPLGRDYADACAAMEYGWEHIDAPLARSR